MKSHEQNIQQEESRNSAYDVWRSLGDDVPFRNGGIDTYEQYQERRQQIQKLVDRDAENRQALSKVMEAYWGGDGKSGFKHEQLQKDRRTELLEREFNDAMTTPQELAQAVAENKDGISLSQLEYQGRQVQVYDLFGHELRFLQHAVDYKIYDSSARILGRDSAHSLLEDPSKWLSSRERQESSLEDGEKRLTDNISTSYVDTSLNLIRRGGVKSPHAVVYAFTHLGANDLIATSGGDLRTEGNAAMHDETKYIDNERNQKYIIHDVKQHNAQMTPEQVARSHYYSYNEVVISRYKDNGEPVLPDMMIVHSDSEDQMGGITEDTLRHAAFFNIPIVRIHDRKYQDLAAAEYRQEIQDLQQENLEYHDLYSMLDHINNSNMIHQRRIDYRKNFDSNLEYHPTGEFTSDDQRELEENLQISKNKFIHLIEKVEPERRLGYLIEQLSGGRLPDQDIFKVEIGNKTASNGRQTEYIEITYLDKSIPQTIITSDFNGYDQMASAVSVYVRHGGRVSDYRKDL